MFKFAVPRTTAGAVVLVVLAITSPAAHAQAVLPSAKPGIPCAVAEELAKKAYLRTVDAPSRALAFDRRLAFWDIHEYSSACSAVRLLASEMKSKDLAVDSNTPATIATAQSFGIEALNLPDGCVTGGKITCSFIVTKPPKVVTSGHEGPKWYTLKKEFDGKPPTWQELQADKVLQPRGSVAPTK